MPVTIHTPNELAAMSWYARLIAANEPDLAPLFATRTLRSDWDAA